RFPSGLRDTAKNATFSSSRFRSSLPSPSHTVSPPHAFPPAEMAAVPQASQSPLGLNATVPTGVPSRVVDLFRARTCFPVTSQTLTTREGAANVAIRRASGLTAVWNGLPPVFRTNGSPRGRASQTFTAPALADRI